MWQDHMEHADHKRIRYVHSTSWGESSASSAAMYRPSSVKNRELMTLYEGDGEECFDQNEDSVSEEDLEAIEEGKGAKSYRSSLSLEIYGLSREQQVYFSNQEYYTRLEELKRTHLRNMADLEKMYISQERGPEAGHGRGDEREDGLVISLGPARKLQRISSQEELDVHETSSGSDYSELHSLESVGELELDVARRTHQEQAYGRLVVQQCSTKTLSPEDMMFLPRRTAQKKAGKLSRQTIVRVRPNPKVTVPKPFQMMLREEERKRHKVRTRSEVELENALLRRELEELLECQKKFRASPAPAHTHLALYDVISQRSSRRNQGSPAASAQPFTFLERERRKKEVKILAELGRPGAKEERRVFKARPIPRSVDAAKHRTKPTGRQPKFLNICTLERGTTEGHSDDPEQDSCPGLCRPHRCVKKQLEVSIELVKESERPGGDTLQLQPFSKETPSAGKKHYMTPNPTMRTPTRHLFTVDSAQI